jgi:hypothetical protein
MQLVVDGGDYKASFLLGFRQSMMIAVSIKTNQQKDCS